MQIQIYNDAPTFRSKIKHVALQVVPVEYGFCARGSTLTSIKAEATKLIAKAMFLRGERDANVRSLSSLRFDANQ
jgi:hypothetical protein